MNLCGARHLWTRWLHDWLFALCKKARQSGKKEGIMTMKNRLPFYDNSESSVYNPAWVFLGVISAFLAVFVYSDFGWKTAFVPWSHDDFLALGGFSKFDFALPRPFSTNFIIFFGSFGEVFYYTMASVLVFLVVSLSVIFSFQIVNIRLSRFYAFFLSFISGVMFFSMPFANVAFQYLGLMTNMLSYVFGIAAGIFLLRAQREGFLKNISLTFLFVMLAAFSKEDMAGFIGVVCLIALAQTWGRGEGNYALLRAGGLYGFILCVPYGLSVLHSIFFHSPFLSNQGAYKLSSPLGNFSKNIEFYVFSSNGFTILIAAFVFIACVAILCGILLKERRDFLWKSCAMIMIVAALMLPYMLLPRSFGYYEVSFIPMIGAGIVSISALLAAKLPNPNRYGAKVVSVGLPAGLAAVVSFADYTQRAQILNWHATIRERVDRQFRGIDGLQEKGLRSCQTITVTGVSNVLGPFMTFDISYLQRRLGLKQKWIVVTEPDSMMRLYGFHEKASSSASDIQFIDRETIADDGIKSDHGCRLDFDPETLVPKMS